MWRDNVPEAIDEFLRRVGRGDTEFPVDLTQTVAGFLDTVRSKPMTTGKKTTAKKTTAKKSK